MRKNKGFTLIELVVVIAVLAILAGVAIPKFVNITTQASNAAVQADLGTIRAGIANVAAAATVTNKNAVSLAYPNTLEANTGPIFGAILEPSASQDFNARGWTGSGPTYTAPNNHSYTYNNTTGLFN